MQVRHVKSVAEVLAKSAELANTGKLFLVQGKVVPTFGTFMSLRLVDDAAMSLARVGPESSVVMTGPGADLLSSILSRPGAQPSLDAVISGSLITNQWGTSTSLHAAAVALR